VTAQLVAAAVALVILAWLAACAEAGLARTTSYRAEEAVRSGRRGSQKLAVVAADPELAAHPDLRSALDSLLDADREQYLDKG